MDNILLFGAGTHVEYCIDIIEREGKYTIAGLIDSQKEIGSSVAGYEILGRQDELPELTKRLGINTGLITIGDNYSRFLVYREILSLVPEFRFVNAIHPSVIIGKNVSIGMGVVMMAGCIINPNSKIGDFTFFATGAQVEHDNRIMEFASVSAGSITGGKVVIEPFAAITLGVIIADRLTIGENTVVGSGSLVLKDLPPNVLAYGRPAAIIRTRKIDEKFLKS